MKTGTWTPEQAAAEIAFDRRWYLKAWLLTVLPPDQIAAVLESPMPPTVAGLIELARRHAEQYADKCRYCGKPLPIERKARKRKVKSVDGLKKEPR
jgi:hypothetical protein